MRWKLRRMGNDWRAFWRRKGQTVGHIRYEHKTCSECGAVQDRSAKVCTSCGAALSSRTWQVFERIGVSAPRLFSVSALFGVMFTIAYFQLVRANGGGGLISIDGNVLWEHGAYRPDMVAGGDWWRLVTACFMHAGLWHIGFNMFALAVIGPRVSEMFGGFVTAFLFLATGVLGNVASGAFGIGAVGASGGIMGLVGAACAAGHREGTTAGRALRNDMLKWIAYVYLFSLVIGANHAAHTGGLIVGGVFGLAINPRWLKLRSVRPIAAVLGILSVLASGWATYAVVVPPQSRYETALVGEFEAQFHREIGPAIEACDADPKAGEACDQLELLRRQCSHGLDDFVRDDAGIEERAYYQARCNVIGPPRN